MEIRVDIGGTRGVAFVAHRSNGLKFHPREDDMRNVWFLLVVMLSVLGTAAAQDPVKVDAKHYKVEFENGHVRVLRIHYGPHEKSIMHSHPSSVAVFLTDGNVKFTFPDGKTQEAPVKAGQTQWEPAGKHLPENTGDKPFEVVLVELKGQATMTKIK